MGADFAARTAARTTQRRRQQGHSSATQCWVEPATIGEEKLTAAEGAGASTGRPAMGVTRPSQRTHTDFIRCPHTEDGDSENRRGVDVGCRAAATGEIGMLLSNNSRRRDPRDAGKFRLESIAAGTCRSLGFSFSPCSAADSNSQRHKSPLQALLHSPQQPPAKTNAVDAHTRSDNMTRCFHFTLAWAGA